MSTAVAVAMSLSAPPFGAGVTKLHRWRLEPSAFGRALFIGAELQSAAADQALYHEALVEGARGQARCARDAIVLGVGPGGSLAAAMRIAPNAHFTVVDIDETLVRALWALMPEWHQGTVLDPRVSVVFDDAATVMRHIAPASFDLVTVDFCDLDDAPARVVLDKYFWMDLRRALRTNGSICVQAGAAGDPRWERLGAQIEAAGLTTRFHTRFIPSFGTEWRFGTAFRLEDSR